MSARTWAQIREVLARVTYRDWTFYLDPTGPSAIWGVTNEDSLDERSESVHVSIPEADRCHVLQIVAKDPETGEEWSSRKWTISKHMTDTEIVSTAWKAVLAAEEHEARERFLYKGQAVFSPHLSVEQLCELHEHGTFDVRSNAMQGA